MGIPWRHHQAQIACKQDMWEARVDPVSLAGVDIHRQRIERRSRKWARQRSVGYSQAQTSAADCEWRITAGNGRCTELENTRDVEKLRSLILHRNPTE